MQRLFYCQTRPAATGHINCVMTCSGLRKSDIMRYLPRSGFAAASPVEVIALRRLYIWERVYRADAICVPSLVHDGDMARQTI